MIRLLREKGIPSLNSTSEGLRVAARCVSGMTMTVTVAFLVTSLFVSCTQKVQDTPSLKLRGQTMGTTYSVVIRSQTFADSSRHAQLEEVISRRIAKKLDWFNSVFSTYRPDSVISRFNRHASSRPFSVPEEFVELLTAARAVHKQTNGRFDPTIAPLIELWGFAGERRKTPPTPGEIQAIRKRVGLDRIQIVSRTAIRKTQPDVQLNLSAIAKGAGVDAIYELLFDMGYRNVMVEIGGEVRTGPVPNTEESNLWRIGIEKPAYDMSKRSLTGVLEIENLSVASSGDYRNYFEHENRRYSHIIDPGSGRPIKTGTIMATVMAPDCTKADAYATALLLITGEEGIKLIEGLPDMEARVVVENRIEGEGEGEGEGEMKGKDRKQPRILRTTGFP